MKSRRDKDCVPTNVPMKPFYRPHYTGGLSQGREPLGQIPQRTLHTGATMPAIGLGTFGSDHISADQVAEAVKGAIAAGYRHLDCASVYGNEHRIGPAIRQTGIPRDELWIASKLWNDQHSRVAESCRHSLSDLRIDQLDMYLVHWPFPNFHPPGCSVDSRSPDAGPYIHDNFMRTWREMEKLVDLGLTRHIGTSNMTIPKLKLLLRDARIKPAVNEMELHPHFQQPELFEFVRARLLAAGLAEPAGARPDAAGYRRHRRSRNRAYRGAARNPSGGCLHQVGGAARPDADSLLGEAAQLYRESGLRQDRAAHRCRYARHRGHR